MIEANPKTTYAFLVGIEKYKEDTLELNGPAKDVEKFAKWLCNNKVPPENISVFLSSLDCNKEIVENIKSLLGREQLPAATKDNIKNFFEPDKLNFKLKSSSLFIFFWGGHGFIDRATEHRCLLYPEARSQYLESCDFTQLQSALKTDSYKSINNQIFFIDTCASYIGLQEINDNIPPKHIFATGRKNSSRKQFVLFAANPGGYAINKKNRLAGIFSNELVSILQEVSKDRVWPPDMETVTKKIEKRFEQLKDHNPNSINRNQTPVFAWEDWKGNTKKISNFEQNNCHVSGTKMSSDKAVILDFDGIIVDTEAHHLRAYNILILKYKYKEKFKEEIIKLSEGSCDIEKQEDCISWREYTTKYIELPTREILTKLIKKRSNVFQCKEECNVGLLMKQKNIIYRALIAKTLEDSNDDRRKLRELFSSNFCELNSLEKRGIYEYFKRGLGDLKPREGLENLLKVLYQFNWDVKIISLSTSQIIDAAKEQIALCFSEESIKNYFKDIRAYAIDELDESSIKEINDLSIESNNRNHEEESIQIKECLYQHICNHNKHWNQDRIVAVEDGDRGVKAAKRTGLRSIFIPLHSTKIEGSCFQKLSDIKCAELMNNITPRIFHISKSNHAYSKAIYNLLNLKHRDSKSRVSNYIPINIYKDNEIEKPEAQVKILQDLAYYTNTQFLPDSLIITPAENTNELAKELDDLGSKGVKIITLDTRVIKPKNSKSTSPWVHISPDFYEGGKIAAKLLIKVLKEKREGKGNIVIFAGPENHASTLERRLGFLGEIVKEFPDIKLLKIEYCRFKDSDSDDIRKKVEELPKKINNEQINAIFCEADIFAISILNAYEFLEIAPPIIVGFDGIKEQIAQNVENGKIYASIDVSVEEQVNRAWRIAINGEGWDIDRSEELIPPKPFTNKDASDYISSQEQI